MILAEILTTLAIYKKVTLGNDKGFGISMAEFGKPLDTYGKEPIETLGQIIFFWDDVFFVFVGVLHCMNKLHYLAPAH